MCLASRYGIRSANWSLTIGCGPASVGWGPTRTSRPTFSMATPPRSGSQTHATPSSSGGSRWIWGGWCRWSGSSSSSSMSRWGIPSCASSCCCRTGRVRCCTSRTTASAFSFSSRKTRPIPHNANTSSRANTPAPSSPRSRASSATSSSRRACAARQRGPGGRSRRSASSSRIRAAAGPNRFRRRRGRPCPQQSAGISSILPAT